MVDCVGDFSQFCYRFLCEAERFVVKVEFKPDERASGTGWLDFAQRDVESSDDLQKGFVEFCESGQGIAEEDNIVYVDLECDVTIFRTKCIQRHDAENLYKQLHYFSRGSITHRESCLAECFPSRCEYKG